MDVDKIPFCAFTILVKRSTVQYLLPIFPDMSHQILLLSCNNMRCARAFEASNHMFATTYPDFNLHANGFSGCTDNYVVTKACLSHSKIKPLLLGCETNSYSAVAQNFRSLIKFAHCFSQSTPPLYTLRGKDTLIVPICSDIVAR